MIGKTGVSRFAQCDHAIRRAIRSPSPTISAASPGTIALKVVVPPQCTLTRISNGMQFSYPTFVGQTYTVEESTNLLTGLDPLASVVCREWADELLQCLELGNEVLPHPGRVVFFGSESARALGTHRVKAAQRSRLVHTDEIFRKVTRITAAKLRTSYASPI
jgi:hypothetical protein